MIDSSDILNGKVLIVDDQETNIRLLDGILRASGYLSISSCMDPGRVCDLHLKNRFDLILLDIQMPGMDGFEVIERLKEIEPGGYPPVLAITAEPSHKLRALQAGAKDFICRPFEYSEVLVRVHNLLEVRLLHKALQEDNNELEERVRARTVDLDASRIAAMKMMHDAVAAHQAAEAAHRDLQQELARRHSIEHQLLQSQKMEIVGNLAGGIAHDFNNILTAVMANLDLIGAQGHGNSQAWEYLSEVRSDLDRAATLTSHLLAFSRRQIIRPVRADLNQVISNIKRMLLRVLGEQIILDIRLADEPVLVLADVGQMEQVLMNLCVNARDAMLSGGTLTIAVRSKELEERYADVAESKVPAGRYAYLEITDTGSGMNAETLARIFEPFFTTKELGKGTGLGLSMVYGIMKQHQGHVFAYSEPGHGTTFKLYLPWMTSAASEEKPVAAAAAAADADDVVRGGNETILVAEDDAAVARGVRRTLELLGYRVVPARDGQVAVETFEAERGRIDLVMLDEVMPRMGGKEVAARITAMKPDQKYLFTSGYPSDKGVVDGTFILPDGINFIQKPYAAADLARAVRKALGTQPVAGVVGSAP